MTPFSANRDFTFRNESVILILCVHGNHFDFLCEKH